VKLFLIVIATLSAMAALNGAKAATRSQRCQSYAHNAMRSTPTSTGVLRGAARGAVGGAIFGNAGGGAAIGAVVGGTRRLAQKSRSYSYYYDRCMHRR
jgi:hypothetical protein